MTEEEYKSKINMTEEEYKSKINMTEEEYKSKINMTEEEYRIKLAQLKKEYEDKETEIQMEYAKSNNPYKKGDIIEDHLGKGRILKMILNRVFSSRDLPCIKYVCDNLNKSGTINKKEPTRTIWQFNILKTDQK